MTLRKYPVKIYANVNSKSSSEGFLHITIIVWAESKSMNSFKYHFQLTYPMD